MEQHPIRQRQIDVQAVEPNSLVAEQAADVLAWYYEALGGKNLIGGIGKAAVKISKDRQVIAGYEIHKPLLDPGEAWDGLKWLQAMDSRFSSERELDYAERAAGDNTHTS